MAVELQPMILEVSGSVSITMVTLTWTSPFCLLSSPVTWIGIFPAGLLGG